MNPFFNTSVIRNKKSVGLRRRLLRHVTRTFFNFEDSDARQTGIAFDFIEQLFWKNGVQYNTIDSAAPPSFAGSNGTFIDSNGYVVDADSNQWRYTHDPDSSTDHPLLGILIEPAKQNKISYSEDFNSYGWTSSNASLVFDSDIVTPRGPNAPLGAWKLQEDSATNFHFISKVLPESVNGSDLNRIGISCFVKDDGSGRWIALNSTLSLSGANLIYFQPSTGTFGTVENSGVNDYWAEPHTNGWWRIMWGPTTANSTSLSGTFWFYLDDNNGGGGSDLNYTGDGTSGIYLWGFQIEDFGPTSYIPTTGSLVTRTKDIIQWNIADSETAWWDNSQLTALIDVNLRYRHAGAQAHWCLNEDPVSLSDYSGVFAAGVDKDTWDFNYYNEVGNSLTGSVASTKPPGSQWFKKFSIAARAQTNNFAISVNNETPVKDTSGTMMAGASQQYLTLGKFSSNTQTASNIDHYDASIVCERFVLWPKAVGDSALALISDSASFPTQDVILTR